LLRAATRTPQRQELVELLALGHPHKEFDGLREAAGVVAGVAVLGLDRGEFQRKQVVVKFRRDRAPVVELRAELQPLPEAANARSRRLQVLHQVVNRLGAGAAQPGSR